MKLTAALVVRDELGRYLVPCVEHLLEFCDELRILDDHSADGTREYLEGLDERVLVHDAAATFFAHEGRIRQQLLEWTLEGEPSHVLSLDADEFVSDGPRVRERLKSAPEVPVWWLQIEEVWQASPRGLAVREDGGWRSHPVPVLWRAPSSRELVQQPRNLWRIADRALACGRVPVAVQRRAGRAPGVGAELLHMGWLAGHARAGRHGRYAKHDRGRFHARSHLESILWPDARVTLRAREWPAGLARWRDEILTRAAAPVIA